MFSHENNPKEAAQKYIDEVGLEVKRLHNEALKAKDLKEFSQKMSQLEKYRDDVIHGQKHIEAEYILNPQLKRDMPKSTMPSLTTGSFIADMNRLAAINHQNTQVNDKSNTSETKIDYSFLLK